MIPSTRRGNAATAHRFAGVVLLVVCSLFAAQGCQGAAASKNARAEAATPASASPGTCVIAGQMGVAASKPLSLRAEATAPPFVQLLPWATRRAHARLSFPLQSPTAFASLALLTGHLDGWLQASDLTLSARRSIAHSDWLTISPFARGTAVGKRSSSLLLRYGSPLLSLDNPVEVAVPCADLVFEASGPEPESAKRAFSQRQLVSSYQGPLRSAADGRVLVQLRLAASDEVFLWLGEERGGEVRGTLDVSGLVLQGWLDRAALSFAPSPEALGPGVIETIPGEAGESRRCPRELALLARTKAGFVAVGSNKACAPFTLLDQIAAHYRVAPAGATASELFISKEQLDACPRADDPAECPVAAGRAPLPDGTFELR